MSALAPYHDLAVVLAIVLSVFAFVCWAMRNEDAS